MAYFTEQFYYGSLILSLKWFITIHLSFVSLNVVCQYLFIKIYFMGGSQGRGQRKIKHFHLGDVTKRSSYGKELIIYEWPITSNNDYTNWKKLYDKSKQMRKDNLLIPQNQQIKPYTGGGPFNCCCCGVDNVVEITHENYEYMFSAQLQNRKFGDVKYYNQEELFYILLNFAQALKQFQINGINFGDIRTKNIAYTKSKQLKMINVASFPFEKTSLSKILDTFISKEIYFLAPEQIVYLKTKRGGNYPNAKSQAFSLSLVLLEAATLKSSSQLYEMPERTFQNKQHENRLNQVSLKYKKFYSYLKKISAIQQQDRITSGQLWSRLNIYRQYINQMKPFTENTRKQDEEAKKFRTNHCKQK